MRIKQLTLSCGPEGNFPIGHVRNVDAETGRQLIAGGYAVEVSDVREPEAATKPAPETAESPANKGRGRGRVAPPAPISGAE